MFTGVLRQTVNSGKKKRRKVEVEKKLKAKGSFGHKPQKRNQNGIK